MKSESEREIIMCDKIAELNGMTADTVLNKFWKRNILPVDIAKILFDMDIRVSAFDFSDAEKKIGIPNGDILGAILTEGNTAAIIYKKGDSLNRVRFTLAHELAHCCLSHITPESKGYIEYRRQQSCTEKHEVEANIFAGELLIPELELSAVLVKYFANSFPMSTFLSNVFMVSVSVMEERLRYLKIPFIDRNNIKVILE